ncbi:MAG TPA: hypothetical protein VNA32_04355 [Actinomycetota bacterium]|nr:hypothetical protein [Actinomycetota bacterium]
MDRLPSSPSGRHGGSITGRIQQYADEALHAFLLVLVLALVMLWVYISLPPRPGVASGARMHDWLIELLGNLVTNGILIGGAVAGVSLLFGGLLYGFSHHEHGQRALKGGGVLLAVVIGLGFVKAAFPHLFTAGTLT